ncbi:Uncharacterised protein [Mycobacteroides abscessus subsp. bolletii]|nr:Uncharacterised protein [Mycobacteroides abscessus subsp. bolletii]
MSLMTIPMIWHPEYLRENAEKLHSLEKRLQRYEEMRVSLSAEKAREEYISILTRFSELTDECEFGRIGTDSALRHLVQAADNELTPEVVRIVSDLFSDIARSLEYCHASAAHAVSRRLNMLDS